MRHALICLNVLLLLLTAAAGGGCQAPDAEAALEMEVEAYIAQLRTGRYEARTLPAFSAAHIPALMASLDDPTLVQVFPVSPLSSYAPPDPAYGLGVLVLWTIEAVRVQACGDALGGFPSQNPFVQTRAEPISWLTDHGDAAYDLVREAYRDWWRQIAHKPFDQHCDVDPLADTPYRWH